MNGPLGLEQGFTIPHMLAGGDGSLTLSLAVHGVRLVLAHGSVVFEGVSGATALRYGGLVATDARGVRLPARLSVGDGTIQIRVDARGARYPLRIDPFVQQAELPAGSAIWQGFGVAVSADGNTALVGGPNSGGGRAWVFTRANGTWAQQATLIGAGAVGTTGQGQGVALSADGNTALIGGPLDNGGTGASWVFTRSGSTWSQQGPKLVGAGAVGAAWQGQSVALSADGNAAMIGGPFDNGHVGAAWMFVRSGSTWSQEGPKLVGTGALGAAEQGWSVALSGDGTTALMGGCDGSTAIYGGPASDAATWVFVRSGSTWTQQGPKLVAAPALGGRQGFSVALSRDGDTALVGDPWDDRGGGGAWVFTRSGSTWTQQGPKLYGPDQIGGALEGMGVSLTPDGNTALLGGPADGGNEDWRGAAWVFTRSGSTWTQEEPKFFATPHAAYDQQGFNVALSGDGRTALLGAANTGVVWVFETTAPPPTIASFSPVSGVTGSSVSITGSNLTGASSVSFGSLNAAFSVVSDTEVDATVPDGAVAGRVSVRTPGGTATSATDFSPSLSVTGFSPGSGPPGTVVDIHGIGFAPASSVKFNGVSATSVSFVSSGEVDATVPAGATSGPVSVTNASAPAGTVRSRSSFLLPPAIGSFSPGSGITGSQVTLTGTDFNGAIGVRFGSLAAQFTVDSATQITATVPDGAVVGKISVTTPVGTGTSSATFSPTLSLRGFSPDSGPSGTQVDITGVGFTPGSVVRFSGTGARTTFVSSGELTALVPLGATTGPISVTNTGAPVGTVRSAGSFTLTAPPPSIGSFSPASGITGSVVTITGSSLGTATGVKFAGLQAQFSVDSGTQISATVPDGAVPGKISVTTPTGVATSGQDFVPSLSLTQVSPSSGPVGTVVTLRGVGFTPSSAVSFNGTTAATASYVGPGEVQATVPSGATSGPVTLTNTTAAAGTVKARYGYTVTPLTPPTIASFTPTSGITGSLVTITGTNLSGANSVKFGGLTTSQFTVHSPTMLRAAVSNGAIQGPITVGTVAGTATSSQTFTPTLSITTISPTDGPAGTVVDVHGVGFTPASAVQFNLIPATAVTYISPTEVKATAPAGATSGPITLTTTTGTVRSRPNYKLTP